MLLGVISSYHINDNAYSSYVLGEDMEAIEQAVKKRNLKESIDSSIMEINNPLPDYTLLSDDEILNKKEELLHSACFLSFVALKSNKIGIDEVLGDEGIIHELSHLVSNTCLDQKKTLTNVRVLISKLQKSAVGFYEPV